MNKRRKTSKKRNTQEEGNKMTKQSRQVGGKSRNKRREKKGAKDRRD